jgi:hypothetical protein
VSDTFLVDRTAPKLTARTGGSLKPRPGRLLLAVDAVDAAGTIARAQYRAPGVSAWTPAPCGDGICDTAREEILIDLPADGAPATITLRVYDATGNAAELDLPVSGRTER